MPIRHGTKVVLIVEDEPDIRESLAELLSDEGYEVCTAANGHEALDLLRRNDVRPGLILLDLMMPVMSGAKFLECLCAEATHLTQIPVVVLTAAKNVDVRGLPTAGRIHKPIDIDELFACVRKYCG